MLYNTGMDILAWPHFIQLIIALILGSVLGLERTLAGKTAGMRTYALVSLGSCLFILVSLEVIANYITLTSLDPLRVASSIVTGVGFIGAGLIIFSNDRVRGLTTAAGLWVSAAIGVSVGFAYLQMAIFTTLLVLFTFRIMWYLEHRVKETTDDDKTEFEAFDQETFQ